MPREIGELRRLCQEWNELVPLARERGIRVRTRRHFHMDRVVARQKVAFLRALLAPHYASSTIDAALDVDTFGVEIEAIMPRGMYMHSLAAIIRSHGVMCQDEHYNHVTRTHWKIVPDVSLGRNGAETVSPPLSGNAGFDALQKVCKSLIEAGCDANRQSCGLHVHVGAADRNVEFFKNLARLYYHFQASIDSIMSPSRRGNNNMYCINVRLDHTELDVAQTLGEVCKALDQNPFNYYGGNLNLRSSLRYRKLNLLPAMNPTNPTVEFRHHQGTSDPVKTAMWVRLCLRMVQKATVTSKQEILAQINSLESLLVFVGATDTETTFFTSRRDAFMNAAERQRRAA